MKGQAALEFLMTYGWALLALVVVLGVLFSSGILSPNYLVSEECSFGTNFKCIFALLNQGGSSHLSLSLFNGFPYKIKVNDISVQTQDGTQHFTGFDSGVEIESGSTYEFNGTLVGTPIPVNVMKRFTGNITYVSCAPEVGPDCSSNEHNITGRISGKISP